MSTDKIITKGKMLCFLIKLSQLFLLRKCMKIRQENWFVDTATKNSMVKRALFQV